MTEMTRTERSDLAGLTRKRATVAKNQARQRAAELTAETEEQLSRVFAAEDVRWQAAIAKAKIALDAANTKIREELGAEGVPDNLLPSLTLGWRGRGESLDPHRRGELRTLARARIDAHLKTALATIEKSSVDVQTQLLAAGLTTGAAQAFLTAMPTPEELLPAVSVDELAIERDRKTNLRSIS
ncbi:hypothetical protein B7R21_06465 [Subtercola boreus]|uniref:Uncharacterized protein n=1 Tax=Subtercola boreus TaxID=120213 RepID=A0A3E0VZK4_9MICO|nr:hypothetical protein [Subtercola boreus]RFA14237.1 hypothetical protein B7R21_06465 [Subtercola boreus]